MNIPAKFGIPRHEFRITLGGTKIDYVIKKENINRKQHGYSLESAVLLLERLVLPLHNKPPHVVSDAFMKHNEVRHMHLSVDDCGDVVMLVTTMRPDETVRIISFRRASKDEVKTFQELTGYIKFEPYDRRRPNLQRYKIDSEEKWNRFISYTHPPYPSPSTKRSGYCVCLGISPKKPHPWRHKF